MSECTAMQNVPQTVYPPWRRRTPEPEEVIQPKSLAALFEAYGNPKTSDEGREGLIRGIVGVTQEDELHDMVCFLIETADNVQKVEKVGRLRRAAAVTLTRHVLPCLSRDRCGDATMSAITEFYEQQLSATACHISNMADIDKKHWYEFFRRYAQGLSVALSESYDSTLELLLERVTSVLVLAKGWHVLRAVAPFTAIVQIYTWMYMRFPAYWVGDLFWQGWKRPYESDGESLSHADRQQIIEDVLIVLRTCGNGHDYEHTLEEDKGVPRDQLMFVEARRVLLHIIARFVRVHSIPAS